MLHSVSIVMLVFVCLFFFSFFLRMNVFGRFVNLSLNLRRRFFYHFSDRSMYVSCDVCNHSQVVVICNENVCDQS